jgi:hypothetical protein
MGRIQTPAKRHCHPAAKIDVAPLQPPIDEPEEEEDASDDAGFPMFGSIEEAAKFFSKHPWHEWVWWGYAMKRSYRKKVRLRFTLEKPEARNVSMRPFSTNAWAHFILARR